MIILIRYFNDQQQQQITAKLQQHKHILNFKDMPFKNILVQISGDCTISEFHEFNESFQDLAADLDCSVQWGLI